MMREGGAHCVFQSFLWHCAFCKARSSSRTATTRSSSCGISLSKALPLNQGILDLLTDSPGALRASVLTTADLRVAKDLAVGRNLQLSLYGDLFNVTNAGTVVRSYDTFPIFAVPAEIISPMVFRVGVRLGF